MCFFGVCGEIIWWFVVLRYLLVVYFSSLLMLMMKVLGIGGVDIYLLLCLIWSLFLLGLIYSSVSILEFLCVFIFCCGFGLFVFGQCMILISVDGLWNGLLKQVFFVLRVMVQVCRSLCVILVRVLCYFVMIFFSFGCVVGQRLGLVSWLKVGLLLMGLCLGLMLICLCQLIFFCVCLLFICVYLWKCGLFMFLIVSLFFLGRVKKFCVVWCRCVLRLGEIFVLVRQKKFMLCVVVWRLLWK